MIMASNSPIFSMINSKSNIYSYYIIHIHVINKLTKNLEFLYNTKTLYIRLIIRNNQSCLIQFQEKESELKSLQKDNLYLNKLIAKLYNYQR